jgi:RNA polymerase sigma factor (sigma-70 family)
LALNLGYKEVSERRCDWRQGFGEITIFCGFERVNSDVTDDSLEPLQRHLNRLTAGDEGAREALLEAAQERLTRLARRMLRDFPGVRRWEDTDDVFQNAALRLYSALKTVRPASGADFLRFAAVQIRRELIDLARRYYGPEGPGAHHASRGRQDQSHDTSVAAGTDTHEPSRLAMWSEFHEKIDALPDEDRALYDLLWYQGLATGEVARLLNVTDRTVQRRWQQLRLKLHSELKGEIPGM